MSFCRELKKWFNTSYRGKQRDLAKRLKISDKQLSNVLAERRGGSEEWRRFVAKEINIPYEEMIGQSPKGSLQKQPVYTDSDIPEIIEAQSDNIVELRHLSVVKRFINKELALSVNEDLNEIEKLKPERFQELATYIKTVAAEVRATTINKPEQKNRGSTNSK